MANSASSHFITTTLFATMRIEQANCTLLFTPTGKSPMVQWLSHRNTGAKIYWCSPNYTVRRPNLEQHEGWHLAWQRPMCMSQQPASYCLDFIIYTLHNIMSHTGSRLRGVSILCTVFTVTGTATTVISRLARSTSWCERHAWKV